MLKSILSTLVMFSSIGCATGCKGAPQFDNKVRKVWSFEFGCGCQLYDLNTVTPITEALPCEKFSEKYYPGKPIQENYTYCDDLVGFNFKDVAEHITPKAKELSRWAQDRCN